MKAYLNDPQLKARFIQELEAHKKADSIKQGTYGNDDDGEWKGCAVACSLRSLDIIEGKKLGEEYNTHAEYETRLGIPASIAHLEDRIFEGLSVEKAKEWPLRFAKAITPGADLSLVTPKLMVWLLTDVRQYATDYPDVLAAIDTVITLYERILVGGQVTDEEWSAARAAASAAARAAASAADAAASAAADAASAAAYAASAAAAAYAASAAADAAAYAAKYEQIADKLIELLEGAPITSDDKK
jgi:hypothetical protein